MKNNMLYEPVVCCTEQNYCQMWQSVQQTNIEKIEEIEEKAIAAGGLLYRFLYESVADGKAIYQIVKVNKQTVRVRLCSIDGLYYDYVVPQWGREATIPIKYAQSAIAYQDTLKKIFAK